ncbi:pre-mRNA-splicing factor ISY1 isoform 1 [Gracilaria domingensis]|nr:pre-mRNA-splicing factor ISY1 isoform 1 [Gracilaria domingensis]
MLSRYLRSQQGTPGSRQRRPYLSTLCDDVDEAEKWRLQVLSDIRRLAEEIQNPGLDDERVRELNDNINKLLRERGHWERRIRFLGGRDYGRRKLQAVGEDVVEHNGYFYFGEAKRLPGVKELLATKEQRRREALDDEGLQRRMKELYNRVNDEYYGKKDEENDADLLKIEEKAEHEARASMIEEWEKRTSRSKDEDWDDSYLKFVGQNVDGKFNEEERMQALTLERKKLEALEQLETRALHARSKRENEQG